MVPADALHGSEDAVIAAAGAPAGFAALIVFEREVSRQDVE
jgi:hypothetical protein